MFKKKQIPPNLPFSKGGEKTSFPLLKRGSEGDFKKSWNTGDDHV
jgi:hypothetical protein